jgi:multicomponent Na+:H+ antiporter subunit C
MEIILALLVGILYTAGVYMLLRRSILKFIIGIIFMSNATNLLVFLAGGLAAGKPAFTETAANAATETVADPVPQALVLTAIVIGLGIVVFTLALKFRFFQETGSDDLDQLQQTDN